MTRLVETVWDLRHNEPNRPWPASVVLVCLLLAAPAAAHLRDADDGPYRLVETEIRSREFSTTLPLSIYLPPSYGEDPDRRYPTLYLLPGYRRGEGAGPVYWTHKVKFYRTLRRVARGRLEMEHLMVRSPRSLLDRFNNELATAPLADMIIVMPWGRNGVSRRYTRFVADELVQWVDERYRTLDSPAMRGLDGGCLGGILSLHIGWKRADVFGQVGAVQPAVDDFPRVIRHLVRAKPAELPRRIQLVSSRGDRYHAGIKRFSRKLNARRIHHRLVKVPGAHGAPVFRGVGGIQLLLFHSAGFREALDGPSAERKSASTSPPSAAPVVREPMP